MLVAQPESPANQRYARHLAVVIASAGRPGVLHDTVLSVLAQSCRPGQLIVAVAGEPDVAPATRALPEVTVLFSERGLTRQRNRAIDALDPEIEIVTFVDDDAELRWDYLGWVERAFRMFPEMLLADGHVAADGTAVRRELSRAYAKQRLAEDGSSFGKDSDPLEVRPNAAPHGCNMSVRRAVFRAIRFDERLPLYGWLEDTDFALACARLGRVARIENCRMVHLGAGAGRLKGRRYGYSQVMNPIYIWHKGTGMGTSRLAKLLLCALLANGGRMFLPGQALERRSRLVGNGIAFAHVLSGRIDPEHILKM